jgi:hypothetical protein
MLIVAILLIATLVLYVTPTIALFKYVTGEARNAMLLDLTEAGRTYSDFYVAPKYDRFRISSTGTTTSSNSILENFVIDGETIYKVASLPADPLTMGLNDTVLTFVTTTYDDIPEEMSHTDNTILDKIMPQAPYVFVEYDNDPTKDCVLASWVVTGIMVDPSISSTDGANNRTTRIGSGKNWTKYTDAGFPLGEFKVPIPAGYSGWIRVTAGASSIATNSVTFMIYAASVPSTVANTPANKNVTTDNYNSDYSNSKFFVNDVCWRVLTHTMGSSGVSDTGLDTMIITEHAYKAHIAWASNNTLIYQSAG